MFHSCRKVWWTTMRGYEKFTVLECEEIEKVKRIGELHGNSKSSKMHVRKLITYTARKNFSRMLWKNLFWSIWQLSWNHHVIMKGAAVNLLPFILICTNTGYHSSHLMPVTSVLLFYINNLTSSINRMKLIAVLCLKYLSDIQNAGFHMYTDCNIPNSWHSLFQQDNVSLAIHR